MTTKAQCRRYMFDELNIFPELYVDRITGEVNSTGLAENCADHFFLYEADPCQSSDDVAYYIPADFLFDLALDIAIAYERSH